MNFLLFLAPFSWGTQKREAAAPKASGCFMGGTCAVQEEPGKQKPRKLQGAGIGPKPCPGKTRAEKGQLAEMSEGRDEEQTCANRAARAMKAWSMVVCGSSRARLSNAR